MAGVEHYRQSHFGKVIPFLPTSEDNELYPEDGLQESPSHHSWSYDADDEQEDYKIPPQMDVELFNF